MSQIEPRRPRAPPAAASPLGNAEMVPRRPLPATAGDVPGGRADRPPLGTAGGGAGAAAGATAVAPRPKKDQELAGGAAGLAVRGGAVAAMLAAGPLATTSHPSSSASSLPKSSLPGVGRANTASEASKKSRSEVGSCGSLAAAVAPAAVAGGSGGRAPAPLRRAASRSRPKTPRPAAELDAGRERAPGAELWEGATPPDAAAAAAAAAAFESCSTAAACIDRACSTSVTRYRGTGGSAGGETRPLARFMSASAGASAARHAATCPSSDRT